MTGTHDGRLDRLLDDFARSTDGVTHALVVSSDGLRLAATAGIDPVVADQLSAATSGLVSLARGATSLLGSSLLSQIILEMDGGYLFATSIRRGSILAVHTRRTADLGLIGYEMTMLAARVGHALTPVARGDRAAALG